MAEREQKSRLVDRLGITTKHLSGCLRGKLCPLNRLFNKIERGGSLEDAKKLCLTEKLIISPDSDTLLGKRKNENPYIVGILKADCRIGVVGKQGFCGSIHIEVNRDMFPTRTTSPRESLTPFLRRWTKGR